MANDQEKLHVENKNGYLFVRFPAYHSVSQAESHIEQMYDAVDTYKCRRLLIDLTATKEKIPIIALYQLCLYLVSKFGPLHAKMAVLASPEAVYEDRFGETVVRNRGLDLIRFTKSLQESLDWLIADPASAK